MDIHFLTCNFGSTVLKKNRFTGKMQSVSVAETLTKDEQRAVLKMLGKVSGNRLDEYGGIIVELPDGGAVLVHPFEAEDPQLCTGLLVDLRAFSPGIAKLIWDLCREGNMAAVPVLKNQNGMVLVTSEWQRERALARWSTPIVVESPDQIFHALNPYTANQRVFPIQSGETIELRAKGKPNGLQAKDDVILDLKSDAADIRKYIADRVAQFDSNDNDGPGEAGPVRMVEIGFEFEQSGWFALVFDTRPLATQDGEWTLHIENNRLVRPHWVTASLRNNNEPISIRDTDGKGRELPPASHFGVLLGEMIQQIILQVGEDGLFASIPNRQQLELVIEEFNGSFGFSKSLEANST